MPFWAPLPASFRGILTNVHARRLVVGCFILLAATTATNAQSVRLPEAGGRTASLGQPFRWHWQGGVGAGLVHAPSALLLRAHVGVAYDLFNPVAGLGSI